MLSARGIQKRYGDVEALRGASLEVQAGQIVALLGRNGAGKSTLLSVIAGLVRADAGTVHVNGIDVFADRKRATGLIGIAPQNTGIYPPLTVRDNLEFFGELASLDRATRRARAEEVAEQLGLTSLLDRKAMHLSGGEARRLHTGCALVHHPPVLMLDEPTVGADVTTRLQLIDAVRKLASDGAAVVYTTHYLQEVEALDAQLVIIDSGRVLASGTQEELIAAHRLQGLDFETESPLAADAVVNLQATELRAGRYRVHDDVSLSEFVARLDGLGIVVTKVETLRPDLESVFLAVTGQQLSETVS